MYEDQYLPAQKCAQHFNPPRSPVYEIPVEYKQVRLGGQASFCEKRHHIVILSVRVSNNVDTSVSWNFDVHDCWLLVKESLAIFQQFAENFRGIQFFKRAVRSPGRFLERAHRLLYPLRTNVVVIVLNGNQLGVLFISEKEEEEEEEEEEEKTCGGEKKNNNKKQ